MSTPHRHHHHHSSHRRHTTEDFVEKVRAIHGDKYSYDKVKYVNTRTKVELVCEKHGSFWTKANSIIANHQGCPKCNYSKGENTIKRVLRRMGIEFIDQYRIPNNRARFRYDFYLPRLRLFIEFQGEQHFRPMGYIGGEANLLDVQRRDRLKYDLAISNKYRMVYFDYKQFRLPIEEFEALVAQTLSKFKPIINTRKQHDTH